MGRRRAVTRVRLDRAQPGQTRGAHIAALSRASAAVSASYIAVTELADGGQLVGGLVAAALQRPSAPRRSSGRRRSASRSSSPGGSAASTISSHAPRRSRHAAPARADRAPSRSRRLVEEVGVEPAQVRAVRPRRCRSRPAGCRSRARRRTRVGQPFALRVSVVIRAHLRHAGSENESDVALRCSTCSRSPSSTAARAGRVEVDPLGVDRDQPVLVGADARPRRGEPLGGHGDRAPTERSSIA